MQLPISDWHIQELLLSDTVPPPVGGKQTKVATDFNVKLLSKMKIQLYSYS